MGCLQIDSHSLNTPVGFIDIYINRYFEWWIRSKPSKVCVRIRIQVTQIAQAEISMSVAFPTHVWKMANICKHIIVWLFSHMCAFSHTYVSKSKHVWKIAPRCKYTNVFGFFQTCWIKVKHLPKLTCVVFYTQVWLFSNIFAKSQTCVEKTIMFH